MEAIDIGVDFGTVCGARSSQESTKHVSLQEKAETLHGVGKKGKFQQSDEALHDNIDCGK